VSTRCCGTGAPGYRRASRRTDRRDHPSTGGGTSAPQVCEPRRGQDRSDDTTVRRARPAARETPRTANVTVDARTTRPPPGDVGHLGASGSSTRGTLRPSAWARPARPEELPTRTTERLHAAKLVHTRRTAPSRS